MLSSAHHPSLSWPQPHLLPQHDTRQGLDLSFCLPSLHFSLPLLVSLGSAKEWMPTGLIIPIIPRRELNFNPAKGLNQGPLGGQGYGPGLLAHGQVVFPGLLDTYV